MRAITQRHPEESLSFTEKNKSTVQLRENLRVTPCNN